MLCGWGTDTNVWRLCYRDTTITSKMIRVTTSSGDIRVKLSNETELVRVLKKNNATCFIQGGETQTQIYGFESLENDGRYTYGPAPAVHERRSPRKHSSAKLTEKKKKEGGGKKVSKRDDKPEAFWFPLCQKYEKSKTSWKNQTAFLRSEESGTEVGADQKTSFSRAIRKYRDGKLKSVNETHVSAKQSGYPKRKLDHPDSPSHVIENPEEVEVSYKGFRNTVRRQSRDMRSTTQ
jgi:hypothetical protein